MGLTSYLGIDVGSVTTKLALVDEKGQYIDSYMLKTAGKPVAAVQSGLKQIYAQAEHAGRKYDIMGVGTTGSGRNLAGALVGADVIKNEITAHAVAAATYIPGVQTIPSISDFLPHPPRHIYSAALSGAFSPPDGRSPGFGSFGESWRPITPPPDPPWTSFLLSVSEF